MQEKVTGSNNHRYKIGEWVFVTGSTSADAAALHKKIVKITRCIHTGSPDHPAYSTFPSPHNSGVWEIELCPVEYTELEKKLYNIESL